MRRADDRRPGLAREARPGARRPRGRSPRRGGRSARPRAGASAGSPARARRRRARARPPRGGRPARPRARARPTAASASARGRRRRGRAERSPSSTFSRRGEERNETRLLPDERDPVPAERGPLRPVERRDRPTGDDDLARRPGARGRRAGAAASSSRCRTGRSPRTAAPARNDASTPSKTTCAAWPVPYCLPTPRSSATAIVRLRELGLLGWFLGGRRDLRGRLGSAGRRDDDRVALEPCGGTAADPGPAEQLLREPEPAALADDDRLVAARLRGLLAHAPVADVDDPVGDRARARVVQTITVVAPSSRTSSPDQLVDGRGVRRHRARPSARPQGGATGGVRARRRSRPAAARRRRARSGARPRRSARPTRSSSSSARVFRSRVVAPASARWSPTSSRAVSSSASARR